MPGSCVRVRCVETGAVYPSKKAAILASNRGNYNSTLAWQFSKAMESGCPIFGNHWERAPEDQEPDGQSLMYTREDLGLSASQLGSLFGKSKVWVKNMESGKVQLTEEVLAWIENPTTEPVVDPILFAHALVRGQQMMAIGHSMSTRVRCPFFVRIICGVDGVHCIKAEDSTGGIYYLTPEELVPVDSMIVGLNPRWYEGGTE